MNQEPLFPELSDPRANEPGGARRNDPQTSKDAAFSVAPRSGTQRWNVLNALCDYDQLHHEALVRIVQTRFPNYSESGIRTRLSELAKGGWVVDSGRTTRTRRGERAILWTLSDQGRKAMRA